MQVYFLRHGEAEPPGPAGDEARQLTPAGRDDVRRVTELLAASRVRPDIVCASPLIRARQTAEIAAGVLGVPWQTDERLRPGASLDAIQRLLGDKGGRATVLIGHEPDLSTIIAQLTGARVRMRPAGLARVDLETAEPRAGVLVWLLSPELAAGK